jgi:hypothetical protein
MDEGRGEMEKKEVERKKFEKTKRRKWKVKGREKRGLKERRKYFYLFFTIYRMKPSLSSSRIRKRTT